MMKKTTSRARGWYAYVGGLIGLLALVAVVWVVWMRNQSPEITEHAQPDLPGDTAKVMGDATENPSDWGAEPQLGQSNLNDALVGTEPAQLGTTAATAATAPSAAMVPPPSTVDPEVARVAVQATRRMVAAHAPLRVPSVSDPDSVENQRILQAMILKGLRKSDFEENPPASSAATATP